MCVAPSPRSYTGIEPFCDTRKPLGRISADFDRKLVLATISENNRTNLRPDSPVMWWKSATIRDPIQQQQVSCSIRRKDHDVYEWTFSMMPYTILTPSTGIGCKGIWAIASFAIERSSDDRSCSRLRGQLHAPHSVRPSNLLRRSRSHRISIVNHGVGAQQANKVKLMLRRWDDTSARVSNRIQPTEVAPPKIRTGSWAQDA